MGVKMVDRLLKILGLLCIVFCLVIFFGYDYFEKLCVIKENSHGPQWWLEYINWDIENRDEKNLERSSSIALIDSGIDLSHKEFGERIHKMFSKSIHQYDILFSHEILTKSDKTDYEHGTAMAGIIVAKPSNNNGVLGINPKCTIRSMDVTPCGLEMNIDRIILAIKYAIEWDVNVINISVALEEDNEELHKIIQKAYNENITIVSDCGNYTGEQKIYPAAYEEVISVGSIDMNGDKIYGNDSYDILAPGKNIVTTYSSIESDDEYKSIDDPSASTAIVSGMISLIYQYNNNIKNHEIYDYFRQNRDKKIDVNKILEDLCDNVKNF